MVLFRLVERFTRDVLAYARAELGEEHCGKLRGLLESLPELPRTPLAEPRKPRPAAPQVPRERTKRTRQPLTYRQPVETLPGSAPRVYAFLEAHPNCDLSTSAIASRLGCVERTAFRALRVLRETGWLSATARWDEHQGRGSRLSSVRSVERCHRGGVAPVSELKISASPSGISSSLSGKQRNSAAASTDLAPPYDTSTPYDSVGRESTGAHAPTTLAADSSPQDPGDGSPAPGHACTRETGRDQTGGPLRSPAKVRAPAVLPSPEIAVSLERRGLLGAVERVLSRTEFQKPAPPRRAVDRAAERLMAYPADNPAGFFTIALRGFIWDMSEDEPSPRNPGGARPKTKPKIAPPVFPPEPQTLEERHAYAAEARRQLEELGFLRKPTGTS